MDVIRVLGMAAIILCACLTFGASAESLMLDVSSSNTLVPAGQVIQRVDDDSSYSGFYGAPIYDAWTSDDPNTWAPATVFNRNADYLMFCIEYHHDGGYIPDETIAVGKFGGGIAVFTVDWTRFGQVPEGDIGLGVWFEPPLPTTGTFDWAVKMADTGPYGYPDPLNNDPPVFEIV